MKVLIQERDTERFYKHGKWTKKREEAEPFDGSVEAVQICKSKKLHADIVLAFRDPAYDVKIPCN